MNAKRIVKCSTKIYNIQSRRCEWHFYGLAFRVRCARTNFFFQNTFFTTKITTFSKRRSFYGFQFSNDWIISSITIGGTSFSRWQVGPIVRAPFQLKFDFSMAAQKHTILLRRQQGVGVQKQKSIAKNGSLAAVCGNGGGSISIGALFWCVFPAVFIE